MNMQAQQPEAMEWWSEQVRGSYPALPTFDYKGSITYSELVRFVRIIMTEGVPFAYSDFPLAFEFARQRAAEKLGVHPKQLSVVGSARIGYSLAAEKFGRPFDLDKSDIDLFVVNEQLFHLTVDEHGVFMKAWEHGEVQPRHELQKKFWEDYRLQDPTNIRRGFINGNHIPTLDRFPVARQIGAAAYLFHTNLETIIKKKIGRKASIRIYRDWDAAIRQMASTLKANLNHRGVKVEWPRLGAHVPV